MKLNMRLATTVILAALVLGCDGTSQGSAPSVPSGESAIQSNTERREADSNVLLRSRLNLECSERLAKLGMSTEGCFRYADRLLSLATDPMLGEPNPLASLEAVVLKGETAPRFRIAKLRALSSSASLYAGVPPHAALQYPSDELATVGREGAFQAREWGALLADQCGREDASPVFLRCARRVAREYISGDVVISLQQGGPFESAYLYATLPDEKVVGVQSSAFPNLPLPVCGDGDSRVVVSVWRELGQPDGQARAINSVPPEGDGRVIYIDQRRFGRCSERGALDSYSYPFFDPHNGESALGAGGVAVNMRGGTSWANGSCNRVGFFKNEVVEGIHQGWIETYFGHLEDAPVSLAGRYCLERPIR